MLAPAFAVTGLLLLGLAGPMDQPPIAAIGRTLVLGSIAMLFLYRVRRQMSLKDILTASGGTSLAPQGGKSSMNAVANSIALNGLGLGITGLAALVSALIAAVSLL
jgi:hypothetical protein